MKPNVRYGASALLLIVACNRPENDLYSGGSAQPIEHETNGGGAVNPAAGGAATAGSPATATAGMAGTEPSLGGTAPSAGAPMDKAGGGAGAGGAAGHAADAGGTAGVDVGAAGAPVQPPEAVCGNGVLEDGEQCDDAGHLGEDGCDASCQVVCSQYGAGILESTDHHCYGGYDQATFAGAKAACDQRGAHLVTISSDEENALAQKLTNDGKWIGAYEDVASTSPGTGAYVWLTGEPFTYMNWAPNEPNRAQYFCGGPTNAHCYEHCVVVLGDGTWADHRCETPDGYVCEWEPAGTK